MKIYCSGIGGIGLSAYAALQRAAGHELLGSDASESALTHDLVAQGIAVFTNQDGSKVPPDADLFVYSEAIPSSAPERVKAAEYGIKALSYFAALGELSKVKTVIAVCGTHGKSTTTAMTANLLVDAGLDPTVIVGTKVPQLGGRNWRKGESDIFLLEACEYRGSFLNLSPNIILMTNVDGDHFDAFDSMDAYRKAFTDFMNRLPEDGVLITHMDDPDCAALVESQITNHKSPTIDADKFPLPELSVPGLHMRKNAQLVAALASHLGIDAAASLKKFSGTWRRMELKGTYQIPDTKYQIPVIDDYAHHPREIAATIAAVREWYPGHRLVCLFQPHTHDRTLHLYNDFLIAFDGADFVVTTDVYDARPDTEKQQADVAQLTADIHTESVYGGNLNEAKKLLCSSILQQGDVLLVMGAGSVTNVAQELVA